MDTSSGPGLPHLAFTNQDGHQSNSQLVACIPASPPQTLPLRWGVTTIGPYEPDKTEFPQPQIQTLHLIGGPRAMLNASVCVYKVGGKPITVDCG